MVEEKGLFEIELSLSVSLSPSPVILFHTPTTKMFCTKMGMEHGEPGFYEWKAFQHICWKGILIFIYPLPPRPSKMEVRKGCQEPRLIHLRFLLSAASHPGARVTQGCSSRNTSLRCSGTIVFPTFLDQKFFLLCNRSHYLGDTKDRKKGIWAQVDSCPVTAMSQGRSGSQSPLPLKQGSGNPQPLLPSPETGRNVSFSTLAFQKASCSIWLSLIIRERQHFLVALLSPYNSCGISPFPCSNCPQPVPYPHLLSL